jgi:hypothetical protein
MSGETQRTATFTLSEPPSPLGSRSSSPSPVDSDFNNYLNDYAQKRAYGDSDADSDISRDAYDATLAPWRGKIRRALVRTVEWESNVIANMQVRYATLCRGPADDRIAERCTNAIFRCIFRLYIIPGNAHIFYDGSASIVFLRLCRGWARVRYT